MNFDNFKYKPENGIFDREHDLRMHKLKLEFIDDLTNNERYKEFFSDFDPDTVPAFILRYADTKINIIKHYRSLLINDEHHKVLQYKEETLERFNLILQKKLWDMQLLWRAEKIKIKDIELCTDFEFWGHNIQSCPFLSEVTDEELQVLKDYLKMNNRDVISRHKEYCLQDYNCLLNKDENDNYDEYPPFYSYYDGHFNTEHLKELPDIRIDKERQYLIANSIKRNKEAAEALKNNPIQQVPIIPAKEYLYNSSECYYEYALKNEKDKHFVELFKLLNEDVKEMSSNKSEYDSEDIDELIGFLKEANVPVYMEINDNWEESLFDCTQQFLNEKILEELDTVFEEYKMLKENNITTGKSYNELLVDLENSSGRQILGAAILNGREQLGEPRDFNF